MKLWQRVLIGFTLGIVTGSFLGPFKTQLPFIFEIFDTGGGLFLSGIKMLIVPLVFSSLVVGVTSMSSVDKSTPIKDINRMAKMAAKTFIVYLGTTALAITIGLLVSTILKPGKGLHITMTSVSESATSAPSFLETLVSVVPSNPIAAMADANILQVLFFAIVFGVAINLTGKKATPIKHAIESIAEVMYKLTEMVMKLAPYGVFFLVAKVAGTYGPEVLGPLLKVLFALYLACFLHVFGVIGGIVTFILRLNPVRFFIGILDAQLVAFTTTSSSGTLPVSMKCAEENLGVPNKIASFVLPLGATINMDGTAIYQGVAALFVAQAAGIELGFGQYVTIILTSTLASIGTAGVPGAGLIMLSLVLKSVGLPLEGIALIAGIDRVLDMARTAVNVTGDLMTSVVISKSENELDQKIYDTKALV